MNRPVQRFRTRARGQPAPQPRGVRRLDRRAGIVEPAHRAAEEALLVDGLVGPDVAKLGRPVRGENDERRARVERLDHRGMELSRGGPRRRQQHDGLARGLGETDAEERARSLVDVHEDVRLRMPLQRHRDRRGPRARRHARVLDALHGKLVHEGRGERLRYVHRLISWTRW